MWKLRSTLSLAILILFSAGSAVAQSGDLPLVHPLFSDNAVLQRSKEVPVWGWTTPGAEITVSVAGKRVKGKADKAGKWMVKLPAREAGGPFEMRISGPRTVVLKNILFGDVWLASGQSNMEMGISQVLNAENEIAAAGNPMLRLFTVPKVIDSTARDTVDGSWQVSSPGTVASDGWGGFSAVAYFFGRKLQNELGIPIGLIHSSWGGTVAEGWVSRGSLSELPDFRNQIASLEKDISNLSAEPVSIDKAMAEWWKEYEADSPVDLGWREPEFDDSGWKLMRLPGVWENGGLMGFDGVVLFRYTFELPESWKGKDLELSLGPIDDNDLTFVNGKKVGGINDWDDPRVYTVEAEALKPGKNTVSVQVLDTGGGGGFHGRPEQMFIRPADGTGEQIPLSGDWRYKEGGAMADLRSAPSPSGSFTLVNARYNAMIAPLFPFAIKGAIWYQGESNVGRAEQYEKVMALLIRDWREGFKSGEFPFLVVQLANFMERRDEPGDSGWARLREAQANIAENDPNSGLAVTIDIGEADDIHPRNKQDVGLRLARIALAKTYGREIEYSGPVFKAIKKEGNKLRLKFSHAEGLEFRDGSTRTGFEVAAADGQFHWAEAKIEGDEIVVWSPDIKEPMAVRYAWADNPAAALYNGAGLPAVPFRTDDW